MNYYYFNSWDNFSLTLKALFKLFKFVSNKSPKATQRTLPKLKPYIFEEASPKGCSERRYHLFRRHLSLIPPSSIGGKVTAERPLDDVGKDVSNVWNNRK